MGNKLGRRRSVVDEKYTKPQGLYQHRDIDIKKLKKLILESKLAPCYPGDEDYRCDLEECPICFLSYPSLNRSRCCSKSICTECFLQLKMPNATRPTQCPFCKTSNYAVEYRGTKTKKEKNMEQIEEQRVIEAKIRMRKQEMQEEEDKFQQRRETLTSIRTIISGEGNCIEATGTDSYAQITSNSNPPDLRPSRDGEFSVDLDDIMLMEAIWLSMQESNRYNADDCITSEDDFRRDVSYISQTQSASSSAGGLANAIATLVEQQQSGGRECSTSYDSNALSSLSRLHSQRMIEGIESQSRHSATRRTLDSRLSLDYLTEQESEDGYTSILSGRVLPESFEEQMTLAMTLSLAEAHAPLPIRSGLALPPRH